MLDVGGDDNGGDGDNGGGDGGGESPLVIELVVGRYIPTFTPWPKQSATPSCVFSSPSSCETPCPLFRYPSIKSESLALLGPGRPSVGGPRWERPSNTVAHASLRACDAQLGGSVWKQGK